MALKCFVYRLERNMRQKFLGSDLNLFISQRKTLVHLVCNCSLHYISKYKELLEEVLNQWDSFDENWAHEFFYPPLRHSERLKFDYVIFKKQK